MRLRVTHTTRYHYSARVFLEPHTIRLRPRADGSQELTRFTLQVEPAPALLTEVLDVEGTCMAHAWFNDRTDSLRIRTSFEVETRRANPFDYFLLHPAASTLPSTYYPELRRRLLPYLSPSNAAGGPVSQFAASVAEESTGETLSFLSALTARIYQSHEFEIREEGDPYPPETTLRLRRAACRDVALLFMECCRLQGIAARFVSGYQRGDPGTEQERHMHAWAEVYLPGGGWRGYDPTHGLVVADQHIAVAAAADPRDAAPVSGTFRGTGITSRLDTDVQVRMMEKPSRRRR